MTEIVLLFIIIALVGLFAHEKRENRILWDKYMKNLKATNAQELRDLELTEKVKIESKPVKPDNDLVAESELDDKAFLEQIHGSN